MTRVQPGQLLDGKYAVENVIGHGGVGVVIAARHTKRRCRVALKFLREDTPRAPEAVGRFVREGQIAARVRSAHVVRVLEIITIAGTEPCLVLEHLEGCDLGALLDTRGRLPVREALSYVRQACSGLAVAHRLGVVHRDVKPSNLFLTTAPDGSALLKIIDFGLAQRVGHETSDGLEPRDAVQGSPPFMPPELLRAERHADARSDIWALGAVLFTLLAGRSPFERRYLADTCHAILSGEVPDLAAARSDVSRSLARVVERCLAKNPEQRFSSAAELGAALAS